ncbi:plasmid-related protein [Vineibacter terrae]|uniref:Plasmid-related protein n=1 Tax=Vineibacter terrae TaxID=2586908 RepID=A0A5C8PLN5_9HYPH|nr:plasmid-related protein [Vineibacter terrae]
MKDAGLRIRVQRELREQFLDVCRAQDRPAAQVLREFMRGFVAQHGLAAPDTGSQSPTKSGPGPEAPIPKQ